MMVTDPVCGMEVDSNTAEKYEYQGKTYYFCSMDCKQSFQKDPQKYIQKQQGG